MNFRILGVVGVTLSWLPGHCHAFRGLAVQAADFRVSHLVDVALLELERYFTMGRHRSSRGGDDSGRHVATGAVKLLDRFNVLVQLDCVGRLPRLRMDHLP